MRICDVLRRCLSSQIWMNQPHMNNNDDIFFRGGGVAFILSKVFLWKVGTVSQIILGVDLLSVVMVFELFQ